MNFLLFKGEYQDEVEGFMDYLPYVPADARDDFVERKQNLLENAQQLQALDQEFDHQVQEDFDAFINEISTYNFVGDSGKELEDLIDEFLNNISNMSADEISNNIETLWNGLEEIKEDSRNDKYSKGIIKGDGTSGTFRPNDSIIRAEVAKILNAAKGAVKPVEAPELNKRKASDKETK